MASAADNGTNHSQGRMIVQRDPLPGEADPKLLPRGRQVDGNWLEVGDNATYDLMQMAACEGQPALINILSVPMSSWLKRVSMFNPRRQHLHCDLGRLDTPPTG